MLSEDTKVLEFNKYRKSDKTLSIVHVDLKSLIKTNENFKSSEVYLTTFFYLFPCI